MAHKPLPAIPALVQATVPNLTTLSIDARNHRGRFIRAILAEAELADDEGWATALEDALDGLSDAVGRGRWLAGVKRERGLRRPAHQHAFQPRRTLARTDTMASNASSAVSALQSIVADNDDHASASSADSPTVEALRQIRALAAQPVPPNPKPAPKHLLLCLAPLGSRIVVPQEDSGFDLIPANLGCVFQPCVFALPEEDEDDHSGILYGLTEWNAGPDLQLVGGTFGFKGITSPLQHNALCKALRISIYMHLSLLLEQHFLTNSGVRLDFPLPKLRHSAAIPQAPPESPPTSPLPETRPGPGTKHKTFLPGILSFFSKKNSSLLHGHRPNSVASASSTRTGASLDLSASSTYSSSRDSSAPASPRLSDDGGSRIRRFSFISASPASFLPSSLSSAAPSALTDANAKDAGKPPFTTLLARLTAFAPLLSSSAGVHITPPPLVIELAAKEAVDPGRRLLGDEKVGLGSILGWDAPLSVTPASNAAPGQAQISSKEARAKAMSGARGFARMQELSVLLSRHVPGAPLEVTAASAAGSTSSLGGSGVEERERVFAPCDRPYWTTWQYYGRSDGENGDGAGKDGQGQEGDRSLGDMVRMLSEGAGAPCARAGCAFVQGEHVMRVVHGGVRVVVGVSANEHEKAADAKEKQKDGDVKEKDIPEDEEEEERIEMWVSCAVCSKRSDRVQMNDGAYLFSFAKFLEVLIYSRAVCTLTPELCEHTSPPPTRPPLSPTSPVSTTTSSTHTNSSQNTAFTTSTSSSNTYNPNKPNARNTEPAPLPTSRFNIVRHFAVVRPKHEREQGHTVFFTISAIEDDIFELRVPRLQITRKSGEKAGVRTSLVNDAASVVSGTSGVSGVSGVSGASASTAGKTITGGTVDEEKRALRKEIKAWWEGVADHLDKLETNIVGSTLVGFRKALPRLPSVDDAYEEATASASEDETTDENEDAGSTPKLMKAHNHHLIAGLPPSAPTTPQIARSAQEFFPAPTPPLARASSDPTTPAAIAEASGSDSSVPPPPARDSLELLTSLRQTFHGAEQALYVQLAQTPVAALNDVRRAFVAAARGAERRLGAWQRKHVPGHGRGKSKNKYQQRGVPKLELSASEPEWWAKGCHTAPGGNIIIREDDWGSIIAFTMSTADYYRELASMSLMRASPSISSLASPQAVLTPTAATSSASSFFSAASTNYKLFSSSTQIQPDPDQDGAVWYEAEPYSAVISRKEHPRDATSLLSLREVLRQKSPLDSAASVLAGGSSRFGSVGSAATKASSGIAPPSAWSKPDVQITRHAAGGEVSVLDSASESAGKILQEIDANAVEGAAISRPSSAMSGSFLSGSMFADMHVKRNKAPSIISVESDSTVGGKSREGSIMDLTSEPESMRRHERDATETPAGQSAHTPTPSSFTNTLTSGISSAMRFMLSTGETPRPSMFSKNHHGLLVPADAFAIDERPHIKYDWTIGKRLKFSCTVYYAKQFDNLRKRCGIDDVFLKSLSRSANWAAEGGKSKSNFWKTADDRFIIKTLVNAWNVADLQVLIELAPSYFRYMDATASRATVLAKLIGFYTIEIRNLETGTVQSKADLLVMENLFYNQKIVKTFDLKGIQGRKVKSSASGTAQNVKTLFDGEWIEGQQRTLTLVRPHSKVVLREAIKSDAEFLAKSNIMDYSLLLGVDQERKQIACGLVDTIGSYTFAKTLEYKAKQGLNSGKEVTVIPPTEYQDRFVSALDGYFLACPDKWSRSMDDSTKPINDPALLPSVL